MTCARTHPIATVVFSFVLTAVAIVAQLPVA